MKIIKHTLRLCLLVMVFYGCSEDDANTNFVDAIEAPINISANVVVTQDNTGLVTITPLGEGVSKFEINYGDGSEVSDPINPGNSINHTYEEGTFDASVIAYGLNNLSTVITQTIVVSFQAPENLMVTIENDNTITRQVNVTASADFAISYNVDFGDDSEPLMSNDGETISYTYASAGTYSITVTAFSAAVETISYTENFEVTEIVQPLSSAPAQPARSESDVISIFSNTYSDILGVDFYPDWAQSTTYNLFDLNGDEILQYSNLNYQGIDFSGTPIDVSEMEYLHIDVWTADENEAKISPISSGPNETAYDLDLTTQQWTSFDIPLSTFTDQNPLVDLSSIIQLKLENTPAGGIIFVDNIYFWKQSDNGSVFDDGLLTNGDFENGSDYWIVGVDDSSPAPTVSSGGDTYYSVNVETAGNAYEVNLSQKVEIIQGNSYTLSFDAWSDVNRSIIAGIGLSADPWTNTTDDINITTTRTNYSLTLNSTEFGAMDARVIFDLGAEIGAVNIDNVALVIGTGNIVVNGDFENGSDSWIIGVDDNSPVPVVTEGGNTYYSVNVETAGNAYDVNASQKLQIVQGNTYTLTFDAWSDVNRSIIAGIGLSGDPWTNAVETVNISTTRTTYTITLSAAEFGAADARIIFDLGSEVGVVNIDDVALSSN